MNYPQNKKSNEIESNKKGIPFISLPKGGGSIRSIGEKFGVNPATGTGSISVPFPQKNRMFLSFPELKIWFRF